MKKQRISGSSSHNSLLWGSIFIVIIGAALYYYIESKEPENRISSSPLPIEISSQPLEEHTFDEIGLSFQIPPEYQVSKTYDDNAFTMTVQKGNPPGEYYQLYMITQFDIPEEVTTEDLESTKKDLELDSIEDTTVAGYPAVSGQIKGERNRYVTYFVKDGQLYTVATAEPTEENLQTTEQILNTFEFND